MLPIKVNYFILFLIILGLIISLTIWSCFNCREPEKAPLKELTLTEKNLLDSLARLCKCKTSRSPKYQFDYPNIYSEYNMAYIVTFDRLPFNPELKKDSLQKIALQIAKKAWRNGKARPYNNYRDFQEYGVKFNGDREHKGYSWFFYGFKELL